MVYSDEVIKGYKNIGKVFGYYKKHFGLYVGFLIITIINAVASFANPILLGFLIEAFSAQNWNTCYVILAIIFGVAVFLHILRLVNVRFFKQLENKVKLDIKIDVAKSCMDLKMKNFDEMGNGVFITRLNNDLTTASATLINISSKFVDFISKIGFLIYVYFLNIYVALLLTVFVFLRYLVYKIRLYYFAKYKRIVHKKSEIVNSTIGEMVRGIRDIKTLNCENQVLDKIEEQQKDYIAIDNKEWYVGIAWCTFADFVGTVFELLFFLLSIYLIGQHSITLAVFFTVYTYKEKIMNFAIIIGEMQAYLKEAEVSAYRVFELQDNSKYQQEVFGNTYLENYSGKITFNNIDFSYNEGNKVLNDVSFEILPNQTTAFVGESGCGKTTIISLICKLYDVDSGTILFDDTSIKDLSKEFVREKVNIVTQSPYIFNMSIRDNFKMINASVSDEDIIKVCRKTGLTSFLNKLPNGLDAIIGEGGTKASGGQRQRLSIARALVSTAKILIFDESTSALDNASQNVVMNTINQLKADRTIIIIAHRLNTIENCDKLIIMQDGVIKDIGTHKQLIKSSQVYKALYDKDAELDN